jgi:S-adenosylmethionine:tRNA ribosyltransferase-isomerase
LLFFTRHKADNPMEPNPQHVFASIKLEDYLYQLPDAAIAKYPLAQRDHSKLLVYRKGDIAHHVFHELAEQLPPDSLLFFNNTKVIPARMIFHKETGARIEIFLLQPVAPSTLISEVLSQEEACSWECMIGNLKRWSEGDILQRNLSVNGQEVRISACLEDKATGRVRFSWQGHDVRFAELVEAGGEVPLPPYLNRQTEELDKPRYQTIYSKAEGAVAAPTAGLHFTPEVIQRLEQKGIGIDYLTLHVSAGTFRPIKDSVAAHPMHREQIIIRRKNLESLLQAQGPVIAVGTTSMRTLESLFWYGVRLTQNPEAPFFITKGEAYEYAEENIPSPRQAFEAVLQKMEQEEKEEIWGETEIFIVPGYRFRVCKGLLTNFHQPESTLMLLVAAFIGEDWRKVYAEALNKEYRFLSYGDSSLLLPGLFAGKA